VIERFKGSDGARLLRRALLDQVVVGHDDRVADQLQAVAALQEVEAKAVRLRTAAMPPRPIDSASLAAHNRVTRSSIALRSCLYFARIPPTSSMLNDEPTNPANYFHSGIDNFDRAP
jgi:hypothetical protein